MRVRDLDVRFPVRGGFLREITGGVTRWLRAVDGVSFDIRRGEILCLVGESGCGKTTTGKAMLRLVDANEGDVFFEMPDTEYARLEELRARGDPASEAEIENLRRKYSFTWKESLSWTRWQIALLLVAVSIGSFLAMTVPAIAAAFLGPPMQTPASLLGFALAVGLILGFLPSYLPGRITRRLSSILAVLAIFELPVAQLLALDLYDRIAGAAPGGSDLGAQYGFFWSTDPFTMLLAYIFAPILAAAVSRIVISSRLQREGRAGIVMRTLRKRLHLIFQDPYESLNPKQSVYEIVSEPLQVNRLTTSPEEMMARVVQALEDAGLYPASEFLFRFPHELSGGQRQRVSIAAALVLEPDFIVADEPVSMLDVSIRTEILQLLLDLRRRRGLTYLFITHDLSLAWVIADRIAVMYLGKIVEIGSVEQVIRQPKHPYTQALISVIPSPDPRHRAQRMILKGERPDPVNIPVGCRFHPRCPMAFEKCGWTAEEVLEDLRELAANDPEAARYLDGGVVNDPRSFTLKGPADAAVAWLRRLKESRAQAVRSLTAIEEIQASADVVRVQLHASAEPELMEVTPGNEVACFLVEPGHGTTVSMERPPAPVPASS